MSENKNYQDMALEDLAQLLIAAKDEYDAIKEKHQHIEMEIDAYICKIEDAIRFKQIVGYRVFESRVNPYSEKPLESFQDFGIALEYAENYFYGATGRRDFSTIISVTGTSALLIFENDLAIHWRVNVQAVTSKPVNVLGDIIDE